VAQVVVRPDWRRRGVAARLMERALGLLGTLGYGRTTLLVSRDNAPAQALYRGGGFVPSSTFVVAWRELTAAAPPATAARSGTGG
jgi:ribosomal protein S18 acetylase RimI-like enzyme